MNTIAQTIIDRYELLPHPEGGFYKENYRSKETIASDALPVRFTGDRSFSTAIYFLLNEGNFSAFHKIKSDECWHFYSGSQLNVYVIHPQGELEIIQLGNEDFDTQRCQAVVPAGCWFASEAIGDYSLVGCTVAPGFDFNDFEMADAATLAGIYPQHTAIIQRLCRM